MSDERKRRLVNEAYRDLCAATIKLARVSPDATYYAFEALKMLLKTCAPKKTIPEAVVSAAHDEREAA